MKQGYLSQYFSGVGTKILTRVDTPAGSNQHEVGDGQKGVVLKQVLGPEPRKGSNRFPAKYVWLFDEQETITVEGYLSWYDTRENQPDRSPEWRLYYQGNSVTELMNEGDRLFVAREHSGALLFIVTPRDSTVEKGTLWLFGLNPQDDMVFEVQNISDQDDNKLDFTARFILDEIGIEFEDPNANSLDTIIERFGLVFPKTAEFSDLARLTLPEVDARDGADAALLAWLNHEEAMFRRLEKRIVSSRISEGFMDANSVDVDGFIQYSLGVQNRRKSRMGHSFENHLKAVFAAHELRYDSQVVTEKGKRPDFIFPGKKEYFDESYSVELLTMLAAKSSCKDRWSQVLPEAERIMQKHLVTLEPGISVATTETMQASNLQLIVPEDIQTSYKSDQQEWLWSVCDFVELVSIRQNAAA